MLENFTPNHWNWISITGKDVKDFLQRLSTIDLDQVAMGNGATGCFLDSTGKIQSFFTLWHYLPGEYSFEFDGGKNNLWKQKLIQHIDYFTFSEDILLTDPQPESHAPKLECSWFFWDQKNEESKCPPPFDKIAPHKTYVIDDEIRISNHGEDAYGVSWFSAWARPARLMQWKEVSLPKLQTITLEQLEEKRIQQVFPKVGHEILDQQNPLELGLMNTIQSKKGCYPGQEVIEKILSLGSPAKRLVQIQGKLTSKLEQNNISQKKLYNLATTPQVIGKITSFSSSDQSKFTALALVNKIHAKQGLEVRFASNNHGTITKVSCYEN